LNNKEVAQQFIIAIKLLLKWIEQGEDPNEKKDIDSIGENPLETGLLTAAQVVKILMISKSNAYRLIQQGEIPSIRIGQSVRVREEDLEEFVYQDLG
jgi:excisionase family DNA binding protein